MRAKLGELEEIPGGAQMTVEVTFEREGGEQAGLRRRDAGARLRGRRASADADARARGAARRRTR